MPKKRRRTREREGGGIEVGDLEYSPEPEVIDYLVPIGNTGFYKSPTEPVDPMDCERWPESPFCGSNPLNSDFIDLTPSFSSNPCETCMTLSPVLGGISLPPYTVCKRSSNPECVPKQPQPNAPNPDNPNLPGIGATPMNIDPTGLLGQCIGEVYIITLLGEIFGNFGDPEPFRYTATMRNPVIAFVKGPINNAHIIEFDRNDDFGYSTFGISINTGGIVSDVSNWLNAGDFGYRPYIYNPSWLVKDGGYINLRWKITRPDGRTIDVCDTEQPEGPPVDGPPYPNPDSGDCCMSCSPDSEELLRLIANSLSVNDFPVKVPQSLLADRGNSTESIQSIGQLIFWFIKQFDAVIGQFPLEIEIKDSDPTKQGDQKQKVLIPNLSEGIAELLGVGLGTNINTNTLINMGVRNLTESGSAKIHALESRYLIQAVADYLAFDSEEILTPVGMTFTPGKVELDDILTEVDQKVPLTSYKDDRDFKAEMTELLFAAAIIRAVHYRKVGQTGDIKEEIKNRIKDLLKMAQNKDGNSDSSNEDNFDDFIRQVEEGFTNVAGMQDVLNPFGRTFGQRPKIRELGDTSDNNGANI